MNGWSKTKAFLSRREGERGQSLVIVVIGIVAFLAFVGLAVDGLSLYASLKRARAAVNTACVYAADAIWRGGNGQAAFTYALAQNGFPVGVSNEGLAAISVTSIDFRSVAPSSIQTTVLYDLNAAFLPLVGWVKLPGAAYERCTTSGVFITPIAVWDDMFFDSLNNGTYIPVVGQGSQAGVDPGKSYRGVVFPFLWCVNSESDDTPNPNCPYAKYFWPITSPPPSPQTAKNALDECWNGFCNRVWAPVGMRLPVVAGTSDNQLCKWATDAGLVPGVDFVAIIYDGTVYKPDPSYGPWENVGVEGWGTFTVVELLPNDNNCNSLVAVATGGIYTSWDQLPLPIFPREIPWDAIGGWE